MSSKLASHTRNARRNTLQAKVLAMPAEQALLSSLTRAFWVTLRLTTLTTLGLATLSALYLIKSALGIDILPGPSPLHDLLFPLLRR
ncbi:MAG: hypothetical protein ACKVP7_20235 [Hyphomicrobiaceae bacterium]